MISLSDLPIRTKLALPFAGLVVLFSVYTFLYFPGQMNARESKSLVKKARTIAELTAANACVPLANADTLAASDVLRITAHNSEVQSVEIRQIDGRVFLHYDRGNASLRNSDETFELVEPIERDGLTIGYLHLWTSKETLHQSSRDIYAIAAIQSSLILAIGLFVAALLSVGITKPLKEMVRAAERITRGYRSERAAVVARDEVGQLAWSFNTMMDSLNRAQDELQGLSSELEMRVVQRTRELENSNTRLTSEIDERKEVEKALVKAKAVAEDASRFKSEFLANMSHEIRTPMNGIIGMTELALGTELTAKQRRYMEAVRKSADSLLVIINDILDFSKIESGKMRLEITNFDVRETVGDTLRAMAVQAREKHLELMYQVSPNVPERLEGDPHRVSQILVNLVGNAIKFTEKGEIVVRVNEERRIDGKSSLLWSVKDTGMGIPREKHQLIFEAFTQADLSTTRKHGGTGLGLTITSQLVRMMGGRIWVESEPGVGSTFCFTTELGVGKGGGPVLAASPVNLAGLPILVVDDNATNRGILCEMLGHWGMAPDAVAGPEEALQKVTQYPRRYKLMLLDVQMPTMSGDQLAEELASRHLLEGISVLYLSSALEPPRGNLADSTWIDKPVKQSELLDAIVTALNGQTPRTGQGGREWKGTTDEPIGGSADTKKLRILLVEDNPVNQELALGILQSYGHKVTLASNGQDAVDVYRTSRFDLVLMDVQMPVMDGFASTAEIRAIEAKAGWRTPIIAMTAHAMDGDRDKCLSAGMDAYVSKPIRAAMLIQTIERATSSSGGGMDSPGEMNATELKEVLDYQEALEQCLGNKHLLHRLLRQYLQQVGPMRSAIEEAMKGGDHEAVSRAAHKFKGTAGAIAARRGYASALALEQAAKLGDLEQAKGAFARLTADLVELSATVEYLLSARA
jgi:two-component system, sensor histidine kinase and response regulator